MHLQPPETLRLIAAAERAARKVCRRQATGLLDPEDVRQDLLADLLARLKNYDPARGALAIYASFCFQHRATRIGGRTRQARQHRQTVSLNAPLADTPNLTLADTLAEADSDGHRGRAQGEVLARIERLLDLDRALSSLPDEALALCALLLLDERDPVGASGLPRTTFYRRVAELRCHLLAAGIQRPRAVDVGAR